MGRPKIKIIDDNLLESASAKATADKGAKKVSRSFGNKKGGDSLIESLKEELGIQEPKPVIASPGGEKRATSHKKETPRDDNRLTRSKKYQIKIKELNGGPTEDVEPIDFRTKSYKVDDAIELVKKSSYSKFTGTLEAHINTSTTGIRGVVSLPFVSGRKIRVAVFGKDATDSGADIIGDEALLENIKKSKMDFDVLVVTPDWMTKLAPLARILGPRGLMPNPKNGTITQDLKNAVEGYHAGKTEYKTEGKAPVMHLALGKLDQPTEELVSNVKLLLQTLGKSRVKKVILAPTMGPAVKLDLSSI